MKGRELLEALQRLTDEELEREVLTGSCDGCMCEVGSVSTSGQRFIYLDQPDE